MTAEDELKTVTEPSPSGEAAGFQPAYHGDLRKLEAELSRDDTLLASLGYKAELKREFTALEVFGLAFSIIGLLPSISSTLVYSMPAGGPVGMVSLFWSTGAEIDVGLGLAYCCIVNHASWYSDGRIG